MRLLLVFLLIVPALHDIFAQQRSELCRCDNATVYARFFKASETPTADNYNLTIEIENESFDNLYYSRKVRVRSDVKDPFIPPYLTVSVLNPVELGKDDQYFIHGGITMHLSTDSTQIFKITMKRNEHTFKPQIRKGEPPQLKCFFNETLIPWDQVKTLKIQVIKK